MVKRESGKKDRRYVQINLTIAPEIAARIDEIAERERRKRSNLVFLWVMDRLEAEVASLADSDDAAEESETATPAATVVAAARRRAHLPERPVYFSVKRATGKGVGPTVGKRPIGGTFKKP